MYVCFFFLSPKPKLPPYLRNRQRSQRPVAYSPCSCDQPLHNQVRNVLQPDLGHPTHGYECALKGVVQSPIVVVVDRELVQIRPSLAQVGIPELVRPGQGLEKPKAYIHTYI